MRAGLFLFLMLVAVACTGFADDAGVNQDVYTLPSILSVAPKIYVLKESDVTKYQLPQNYMMVTNPSNKTVTLWEFPKEFPSNQPKEASKPEAAPKPAKTDQDKPKPEDQIRPSAGLEQMSKILKSAGLDSSKEVSIYDVGKALLGTK